MTTVAHAPLAMIHAPHHGPSLGFRATCTLGCCDGQTWHETEEAALAEAHDIVQGKEICDSLEREDAFYRAHPDAFVPSGPDPDDLLPSGGAS